jgi:uncharacterized protein
MSDLAALTHHLIRIADALERINPPPPPAPDFNAAEGFLWHGNHSQGQGFGNGQGFLEPVKRINRIPLDLLVGVDHIRDILVANTERFSKGLSANNVLLWGARGMGKSSLVKAAHGAMVAAGHPLRLIELAREEIETLPALMNILRAASAWRFIIFCDDLSFDAGEAAYKSLKAVLDGGIAGRPENVLIYATSNRRHLLPRDMIENERSTAIHAGEAVEEKVSLSDRFGLWLGVYACNQEDYLAMIDAYARHFHLTLAQEELHRAALEWTITRGARNGRVAWQFIQDVAAQQGVAINAH